MQLFVNTDDSQAQPHKRASLTGEQSQLIYTLSLS